MIVLDTDVVSELMHTNPQPRVLAWLDRHDARDLFTTVVSEAEIRTSIALLLAGWRRDGLAEAADRTFDELFSGRVLPFDAAAVQAYAEITASRAAARRPSRRRISQFDCQTAAIARSCGMALATRDVDSFSGCGIEVMDPWGGG